MKSANTQASLSEHEANLEAIENGVQVFGPDHVISGECVYRGDRVTYIGSADDEFLRNGDVCIFQYWYKEITEGQLCVVECERTGYIFATLAYRLRYEKNEMRRVR